MFEKYIDTPMLENFAIALLLLIFTIFYLIFADYFSEAQM